MNRFTVVWTPDAVEQLADLWLRAANREVIVSVVESLDLELTVDPFWKSLELTEGLHYLDLPPIRAVFSVDSANRLVEVARIRLL